MTSTENTAMSATGRRAPSPRPKRVLIALAASVCLALFAAAPSGSSAQTATPFGGGFSYDSATPIEILSDSLEVRNEESMAIFRGSVRVRQGEVSMTARELRVTYAAEGEAGAIDRLEAVGDVIITNGSDTAEAQRADYDIATGEVVMTGDVMLVQCRNAIAGPELRIDLETGTANMSGPTRVLINAGAEC